MLTGVVLARNEERNICECLRCLRPHVSELLLIDMESEDRTVELARPYVDRILQHPLIPQFDAARNMAISEAANEWLWFVDADERIPDATGKIVNQLIREKGDQFEAINIPFKSHFCGKWIQGCGWWSGYRAPRVLKRGNFRFSKRLHGGVDCGGRQVLLKHDPELAVNHFSYRDVEHYVEKCNRYTSAEALQMAERGLHYDWRHALRHMVHDLWLYYEHNDGHIDGQHGWILSWLSGQYRWLSHAKLLDFADDRTSREEQAPKSLDDVVDVFSSTLKEFRARSPRVPLGIIWRSPIWDVSGYADESRTFAKALASSNREVSLEEIPWSDSLCDLPSSDCALLRLLLRSKQPMCSATITSCIPTLPSLPKSTSLNILRTTFETDRMPETWHPYVDLYDEVWVISEHNYRAFVRSWIPPEKIRIVPSCVDTKMFSPDGDRLNIPSELANRFVFLSVFDWNLRKGWDVLLKAYVREFSEDENAGLLLKITRNHGHSMQLVNREVDRVLAKCGQSLASRRDITLWDCTLGVGEMAALYRSVDAFVLPSRGEGWGRPYMEAMASGLPTIGTRWSGNLDFMDETCSFLVEGREVEVPEDAWEEIPPYQGHCWFEPETTHLSRTMRQVSANEEVRDEVAKRGYERVWEQYRLERGREHIEEAISAAEQRFVRPSLGAPHPSQVRVRLEGELFAQHSFAKVNEQIVQRLGELKDVALTVDRREYNPVDDKSALLAQRIMAYVGRDLGCPPQITIRHSFPPNWEPVEHGLWVHIQPWEYGHLPCDWIHPLKNLVDEIWVPSSYVKRVYEASGIDPNKIFVVPWGIDPTIYRPDVPPLLLPTQRSFRFLFVGGLIGRKGFDRVLEAYLQEFKKSEDVALIVKGIGEDTFYRYGNYRNELARAQLDPDASEIVFIDRFLTEGQMPSLYAACDCLVAPYRGEGFGLPILEAMACGLSPLVPCGGASDDYLTDECSFKLPSREVETSHVWQLCGPALEVDVEISSIRRAMRQATEQRDQTKRMGEMAASHVRGRFTWEQTVTKMRERIREVAARDRVNGMAEITSGNRFTRPLLAALIVIDSNLPRVAARLASIRPLVTNLSAVILSDDRRALSIAREYGVIAHCASDRVQATEIWRQCLVNIDAEWIWLVDTNQPVGDLGVDLRSVLDRATMVSEETAAVVGLGEDDVNSVGSPSMCLVRNSQDRLASIGPCSGIDSVIRGLNGKVVHVTLNQSVHSRSLDICRSQNRTKPPLSLPCTFRHLPVENWLEPWVPLNGHAFIDVGANIGLWTRWLAPFYDHVYAIEPNPAALRLLRSNLPQNVTVHGVGAWSANETVSFSRFAQPVHLSAYFKDEGIHTGPVLDEVTLPCVTIDSLEFVGSVDFIKCDVEGAELECLKGAQHTINFHRPVLLVEIHSIENFNTITTLLAEWQYSYFVVRDPNYEQFSHLWYSHCWLACQPDSHRRTCTLTYNADLPLGMEPAFELG